MTRTTHSPHHAISIWAGERRQLRGFTVVELIIVIVVIAILAALVVGYNGVQDGAAKVSLQSDLSNAASALERDRQHDNGYPSSADEVDGGLPTSKGNSLEHQGTSTDRWNDRPTRSKGHLFFH